MAVGRITKKIAYQTDVLLQKCKLLLMERGIKYPEWKIIDNALRLYEAYLLGKIQVPEDVFKKE